MTKNHLNCKMAFSFHYLSIFLVALGPYLSVGLPQNNNQAGNRQVGGLSFAIPGLSLLAGGNGGLGGNGLFGTVTVTRTLVSTVSTVTTASFRTCTATPAAFNPCAPGAGRRRRNVDDRYEVEEDIEATPAMQLIIGSTTISDPVAVTDYLEAHKPSTQSVIYPEGVAPIVEKLPVQINFPHGSGETTELYPSQDTPDATESELDADDVVKYSASVTTETPNLQDDYLNDDVSNSTPSDTELSASDVDALDEGKARRGLGKTTTSTTIIRVTSVATSLATGTMATLTVMYMGCSPPVLPVSGLPCTTT